ncbi:bifunctional tryptophan synthase trp1 [Podila humilis]|nr:bifunctional tryptophan synthase trp1 [Podila humilis]
MSVQKKQELVELVLLELGLKDCADTTVGDPGGGEQGSGGIRGISGGERRRVSAAVQLLTNPKMLLCDEVTSGLDAFSSFEVMKSLAKLAKSSQKTIVISIHQPRSEIFKLLSESDGQMVLLSRGDVVYSGPVRSVLPWIEAVGLGSCPTGVNPFDYLLDLSMIDFASESMEKSTAVRREALVRAWAERERSSTMVNSPTDVPLLSSSGGEGSKNIGSTPTFVSLAVDIIPKGVGPSLWSQIRVLTARGWTNQRRDSIVIWGCLAECILIGVVVGAIFFQMDRDEASVRSRTSLVYAVGAVQTYLMLMIMIYRLSQDIMVYDRERMDRWYGPLPHLVSGVFFSCGLNILYPAVFSVLVYYMTGLRTDAANHFGWWLLVNTASQFVTYSFAVLCTAIVRGFSSASLFGNAIFAFFGLSTGFFVVTSSIPVWLRWIRYLAYPNLCYSILASNEFTDNRFACPAYEATGIWDPVQCARYDGNTVLEQQLGLKLNYFPGPIAYLAAYFFGFLFVSWIALSVNIVNPTTMGAGPTLMDIFINQAMKIIRRPKTSTESASTVMSHSSAASSDTQLDIEMAMTKETRLDVFSRGLEKKEPVTIRVEGLGLSVFLSQFSWSIPGIVKYLRKEKKEKRLLKDVDVVFPAGELTAILGGSGAGKTSLLNVLLHRTSSDLKMTGGIYFNGTKNPSLRMINSVCSYVRQDDNFLLSHLTVRETLQYAAELRMNDSLTKQEKHSKVEDIIDLLGLRECADVIIGNSAVKGCSGGQRRRVSIGIQLVTEPSCLFLDEPTSGLDALTAKAVVLTLKQIAASGRTVVCTIHQPRADIWHVFDNVVLLVTGGCAAYSGRADKVVEYFEEAGHVAPAFTNIPDFILDTASINTRSEELEATTRKIVNALVERFNTRKAAMLDSQLEEQVMEKLPKGSPQFASFGKAFPVLTRRSFVNTFRQKGLYFNRIFQPTIVAIIMTIFFAPLSSGPDGLMSRLGLLQQTTPMVFSGMLNNVAMYPFERDIAYREISDGGYSPTSFFFSFLVNELPLELFGSLGVTVFMLVITQMKTDMMTFFVFWGIMFGYINTGESIGLAFSTFASHAGFNITIMSAVISVFSLMTGFMSLNLPKFLDVINHISLFKYGSVLLARNEFDGLFFECSDAVRAAGACPSGEATLSLLKFDDVNWELYMCLFVAVVILYRLAAWLALVLKHSSTQLPNYPATPFSSIKATVTMTVIMIDNYDSFTWNIYQSLCILGANVQVYRNDAITVQEIAALNPSHLVISPGPGHPSESAGVSKPAIEHFAGKIPVLGVCLGEQCMFEIYGGTVGFAGEIVHGKVSPIKHDGKGLYLNIPQDIACTRYHSLSGVTSTVPEVLEVTSRTESGVIMGVRHRTLCVEGVQYHPESVLSEHGQTLFSNFLKLQGGTWKENPQYGVDSKFKPAGSAEATKAAAPSILTKILAQRLEDVAAAKALPGQSAADLKKLIDLGLAPKQIDFVARVKQSQPLPAIMGEIKRASPSKGNIDLNANAAEQSLAYARAGASVISVLTEPKWFKGSLNDMRVVRAMIDSLPSRPAVLRKDFIVDTYQILEARVYGADTILLIVAMLSVEQLHTLYNFAVKLGMEPLVEVNNAQEMEVAIELGAKVIGVNNRNLHNFEVDMKTTTNLVSMVPQGTILVALSGIKGREDVERYVEQGVGGVLVGEALMLSEDKRSFIRGLLGLSTQEEPSKVLVKICGVQTVDAALQAADLGADFIGMIFAEGSKRKVEMNVAAEIVEAVREYANATAAAGTDGSDNTRTANNHDVANVDWFSMHAKRAECNPRKPMIVGVFRDQSLEEMTRIVDTLKIDLVQFHGGENAELAKFLPVPVIKAFHIRGDESAQSVIEAVTGTRGLNAYCLLDAAGKAGGYGGGEGNSFDWSIAKQVIQSQEGGFPVLLAGGLDPENVAEAVRQVRPWAVDVSSGVESNGEKDESKIQAFIERAKAA